MDMSMNGWKTLKCKCGSELFVQAVKVVWKGGGGATHSPVGMVCMGCKEALDVAKATRIGAVEEARRMLEELEAQG